MNKSIFFLFLQIAFFSLVAQNSAYHAMLKGLYAHTIPTITVQDLQKELLQKKEVILLDSREAKEFAVSHLQGAKYVGYDYFDIARLSAIAKDKEIVVYCSVGYRSEKIGEKLKAAGYTNVKNLYGGIFEWINAGNVLVNDKNLVSSKVHGFSQEWGIWVKKGQVVY
jgi:rhodanese-related sulfurtransferase